MTIIGEKIFTTNEKYSEGVYVEQYGNEFSLCLGQTGSNGNDYMKWVFPSFRNKETGESEPGKKIAPLKISLGINKAQAIETLRRAAKLIQEADDNAPKPQPKPKVENAWTESQKTVGERADLEASKRSAQQNIDDDDETIPF